MEKRGFWPYYKPGRELMRQLMRISADLDQKGTRRAFLDATESAKCIRATLKDYYQGVKFSVKTSKYAGGASVNVGWEDGPDPKSVNLLVQPFSGASFDGMQDLKEYHDAAWNGLLLHWGADFVFAERHLSEEGRKRILDRLCKDLNVETLEYYRKDGMLHVPGFGPAWDERNIVHQAQQGFSF